jgi:hypothetical protein
MLQMLGCLAIWPCAMRRRCTLAVRVPLGATGCMVALRWSQPRRTARPLARPSQGIMAARTLWLATFGVVIQHCHGCVCPAEQMDGVWGGIRLTFRPHVGWAPANQSGDIVADTSGSQYAALGDGVGAWSGGYHYFKAYINFSRVPGHSYSGQLDCSCDNLAIGLGRDAKGVPSGVPKGLDLMLNTTRGPLNWTGPALLPPSWVRNLSIYEINPRGFTSPAGVGANGTCRVDASGNSTKGGCGSGTWRSLAEQGLPHLAKLGVTGLWIAGSGVADAHFFGIWSTYASVDPSRLDPVLGTEEDFKSMVEAAHSLGIRVFLDVTTHGLVNGSPLTDEHPEWFLGGKWAMTDFKCHLRHIIILIGTLDCLGFTYVLRYR